MTRDQHRSLVLGRAVAEKLVRDPGAVLVKARANLAVLQGAHSRGQGAEWLARWAELLEGPVVGVVEALTADTELARELRQNSPFAGVLTVGERAEILAESNDRMPIGA